MVYDTIENQLNKIGVYTQLYGVTLTLNKKYELDDPIFMHRLIQSYLSRSWRDINYIIFGEFTDKGRLHYHGVIWDCYKLTLTQKVRSWRRKFGFAKIELKLKTYRCDVNSDNKHLNSKYPKCCWKHYISKDHWTTGLWTLTNFSSIVLKVNTQ